jgi:hypothetical protein
MPLDLGGISRNRGGAASAGEAVERTAPAQAVSHNHSLLVRLTKHTV